MSESHYTGKTEFVDDCLPLASEVIVGIVGAPYASGRLMCIEVAGCLDVPGVRGVFTSRDFAENHWGAIKKDQPFLVSDEIGYKGEPVVAIAADTYEALWEAKRRVKIEVIQSTPVLSIKEAFDQDLILYHGKHFRRGNVESVLLSAPARLEGQLSLGGQEHFYLEPQSSIAIPIEGRCLKIVSATQHPTETQQECALATGLGFQQVHCEVRRLGGGFGGKESQATHFAGIAALVAHKLQRPARLILNRDDDFRMTGKRHPFFAKYEVGFDDQGRILALKIRLVADGGAYTDLSPSILDRALYHVDGAYFLDCFDLTGCVVKTNTPSNTALRGFGGPQGNLVIENIIEEVAQALNCDSVKVRKQNLYGRLDRQLTPYGQIFENNQLHILYDKVLMSSQYDVRRQEIERLNQSNKDEVRGLALSFTKFGISFTSRFLNQGSCLLHLQTDGSAQVSTGAVEMGQNVRLKLAKIIERELGIPIEKVEVLTTSTERNANTSPTAASSGTDINGMATLIAARQVKENLISLLEHWRETEEWHELKGSSKGELHSWHFYEGEVTHKTGKCISIQELFTKARQMRVSLSSLGHYKTPDLEYSPFYYFTQGACVSEVIVDLRTGQVKVLAADIIMDLGQSLDEKIDRGQIAGAFIQGMGWMMMEELVFDQEGTLKTHSPSTYKIPLMTDLPQRFHIDLIANTEFKKNIFHSKAVGEPPLLLSASVWLAIKNALSYRVEKPHLKVPATPENVYRSLSLRERGDDEFPVF